MTSEQPAKHRRLFILSLLLFVGAGILFIVSVVSPSCRQQEYPVFNGGDLPASLTESNLPMYLAYLHINQKTPHQGLALMGGMGGVSGAENTENITCGFRLIFVTDATAERPAELSYITSAGEEIKKAELAWAPFTEYGLHTARVDINFLHGSEINGNELFISIDGEQWYPYLMIVSGYCVYFVRTSALPMEENEDGYPLSQAEKVLRRLIK